MSSEIVSHVPVVGRESAFTACTIDLVLAAAVHVVLALARVVTIVNSSGTSMLYEANEGFMPSTGEIKRIKSGLNAW
jgi:hypothetical protein